MNHNLDLDALLKQAMEADVTALRQFLTTNLEQPLVATGSGGAESVADFAALLYGARGGIATAVSPYTLNVYSDEALKTSKLLLVSKGGHNNDIVFAAKRGLAVNPTGTASFTLSTSDRNDGAPLSPEDFKEVRSFVVLHGSWGRPSAANLEGKFVESGLCPACVVDFRNYCHGRFIFTSGHLEDSAVVMFVSPREKDIAARTRKFLPASTKLVLIETDADAPEASLDLLIRSSAFFFDLCGVTGTNWESPKNPGKIDKRQPMWVPFMAEMKRTGPLALR